MYKYLIYCVLLVSLTGCADNVTFDVAKVMEPVGFWYGVWHGMTCSFAFIGSLFSDSISIYAIYNTGAWYDFGFLFGTGILGSTLKIISKTQKGSKRGK